MIEEPHTGDLGPLGLSRNEEDHMYTPQYHIVWDTGYYAKEVTV